MSIKFSFEKIIILVMICLPEMGLAQNDFTIKYIYSDTLQAKSFYFPLLKPGNDPLKFFEEIKPVSIESKKEGNLYITKCKYQVIDTAVCIIGDGFGHQSFVVPNDSVTITFNKMKKLDGKYLINNKYTSTYFNDFKYTGNNRHIYALFDSLAFNSGSLFMGDQVSFKNNSLTIDSFFNQVTMIYMRRLNYLNTYTKRYKIPITVYQFACKEIKSAYIDNLLNPLSNLYHDVKYSQYSQSYIQALNDMDYNNPKMFFNSIVYYNNAYRYINEYKSRPLMQSENADLKFKRTYNYIQKTILNKRIRERLSYIHLSNNIKNGIISFDSVFKFKNKYPKLNYVKSLDSLYLIQKNRLKVTLEQALDNSISDKAGKIFKIKDLLKSKPLIIDCWASWCIPCLQQMPYSFKLAKQFKNQVRFLYLSFDKDKSAFITKSNSLQITESYLLSENFQSAFAKHFDINAIPRYLVFDKNGNLVTAFAPRPSHGDKLEEILKELIK